MRISPKAPDHTRGGVIVPVEGGRWLVTLAGYSHVTQVVAPGEYCVRGSLIDLFPMGSALPYRIDLADDEIDSIRTFDVDTQRTVYKVREIRLLPAREFPLDDAARQRFLSAQAGRWASVLVERRRDGEAIGHSEHFAPVRFIGAAAPGDIVRVEITGFEGEALTGRQSDQSLAA